MDEFKNNLKVFGLNFLNFAIVMVIGVILVKLLLIPVKRLLLKSRLDRTVKTFMFSIVKVLLYGLVSITALGTAKVDITSLVTALGAAALTASLALQDTLKNFVSGIIVLFTKPFSAGDLIQIEGFEGYVDSIRIFYTQIHTFDNRIVQIPNFKLTSNNVTNCSAAGTRRVDLKFSVSYDDNLTKVKSVIYGVLADNKQVLDEPESKVYIGKHLDSGVEIIVFTWANQDDYYSVMFKVQEDVKNAFDENGITIPYPHIQLAEKSNSNNREKTEHNNDVV